MTDTDQNAPRLHYICQTYVEESTGKNSPPALKIDKQFEYTTASEAQNRAEREAQVETCAGADAYMISEDPNSGEVNPPEFLVRIGNVPEFDAF